MSERKRPSLPVNFYNDISFIEELCDLTRQFEDEGVFAGQQQKYDKYKLLRDFQDIWLEDEAEIGNVQVLKWEAHTDWCWDFSEERKKKAIKLLIRVRSDSEVLTNVEGNYFLTVPSGDELWEGKYELTEAVGTGESTSDNQGKGVELSNGKKLRPDPYLLFHCDNFISSSWILTEDDYNDDVKPLQIPILKNLADQHQQKDVEEGVLSSDKVVPCYLHKEIEKLVLALQNAQNPKDYHPHSKQVVQDIVHPALFCYVHGISYIPESLKPIMASLPARNCDDVFHGKTSDLFGRKYEDSKYQWLPTDVMVEMDGKARFVSPVNNLDSAQIELHDSLEQLLTLAVPYFEEALGFVNRIGPLMHPDEDESADYLKAVDSSKSLFLSLKGKRIQVIPKIVTYHLNPGQIYEGVWHVEGMSHENIVATGLYILNRDQNITGGELMFKRQYTVEESSHYMMSVPQSRNSYTNAMILQGYQPLGKIATPQGRFIVFPNSHAHKLTKLQNLGREPGSRTIVVFFLVHPAVTLISTALVPNQNWTKQRSAVKAIMEKQMEKWGIESDKCESTLHEILEFAKWGFTIGEAKKHRLELMKERKYNKQTWNIREVELCEH